MTVYNPETGSNIQPGETANVIMDTYWHRRLTDGEIELVTMNEKVIADGLQAAANNSKNTNTQGIDDQTKNSNNQGKGKRGKNR